MSGTTEQPIPEPSGNDAANQPARLLGLLFLCTSFLFMALPGIDLSVSHWFASPGGAFPWADNAFLQLARDANRIFPYLLIAGMLVVLLVQTALRTPWIMRPYKAAFVLAFYALGPGLVVQSLKFTVGRARPYETIEFGGTLPFTAAWQISDACVRSCSFVSGEAATAIAMLCLAMVVTDRWKAWAWLILVPLVLFFSLNRIAFGAHFLSDVALAWLLMLWIMAWMWPAFARAGEDIDAIILRRRPAA